MVDVLLLRLYLNPYRITCINPDSIRKVSTLPDGVRNMLLNHMQNTRRGHGLKLKSPSGQPHTNQLLLNAPFSILRHYSHNTSTSTSTREAHNGSTG